MEIEGVRVDLVEETYLGGGLWFNPRKQRLEARHAKRGVIGWLAVEAVPREGFHHVAMIANWWEQLADRWAAAVGRGE